ncbi:MAG: ATP-binding protein [Acidimicrobiia bacterium]
MSLRTKLMVALALLAAVAATAVGAFALNATSDRLRAEVDSSLDKSVRDVLEVVSHQRGKPGGDDDAFRLREDFILWKYVDSTGSVIGKSYSSVDIPVTDDIVALAATGGMNTGWRSEVTVDGQHYRMATVALGNASGAIMVARSLEESDSVLDSLRNQIIVAVAAAAVAAAIVGWLIARQITRRLVSLTATAEQVAATGNLDVPVPVSGSDEAGRLGNAFNGMLEALASSRADQQRLVQDAGHELRTPLTSLRTNVSVLRRLERLSPEQLHALLDDLDGETRELTDLVNELVELATDRRDSEPVAEVDLGTLARQVAQRAQRRTGREVSVAPGVGTDVIITGRARMLERAISNLVDNAAKFDPDGTAPIEIVLDPNTIEVRDRGPGIDPEDLPHLFERFYRAMASRSRPGSGLGLSIVQAVAEVHGGTAFARNRDGGGAIIGFTMATSGSNPALT